MYIADLPTVHSPLKPPPYAPMYVTIPYMKVDYENQVCFVCFTLLGDVPGPQALHFESRVGKNKSETPSETGDRSPRNNEEQASV